VRNQLLPALDRQQAAPLDPNDFAWDGNETFLWYDAAGLTVAGKGWSVESRRYERLPMRAEGRIPEKPWRQSLACAGLSLRFESDATLLLVRWWDYDGRPCVEQTAPNCPSLYVRHNGRWRWLGLARQEAEGPVHRMVNGLMPAARREYMLYLPLQRGMTRLEIAVPAEATIAPCAPRAEKPVVFYGTSITQGGAASRPGTNYVALIERYFDYPVVNLGFSGSAQMEPDVIDLVNELDGCLFVLDCLPNMVAAQVRERFAPAVQKIRAAHPAAPIVAVDSIIYQDGYLVTGRRERCTASNAAQREEFARLVAAGVPGLHYIQAHELFTDSDEATVDGTHPNDTGFRLMTDAFIKVLTPLMPDRQGQLTLFDSNPVCLGRPVARLPPPGVSDNRQPITGPSPARMAALVRPRASIGAGPRGSQRTSHPSRCSMSRVLPLNRCRPPAQNRPFSTRGPPEK
jgi:hypothetical protein